VVEDILMNGTVGKSGRVTTLDYQYVDAQARCLPCDCVEGSERDAMPMPMPMPLRDVTCREP